MLVAFSRRPVSVSYHNTDACSSFICAIVDADRYGSRMQGDVAYQLDFSRHRKMLPLGDAIPKATQAWIAPNSTLAGQVYVSNFATVWYGVTIRADFNPVRIGNFSSIGDGSAIYANTSMPHN